MALPNLNTEKYSMTLPSTGKKLSFRPFLVKEEKVLLLAQEAGKINEMTNALKTIIKNCTFGKVEVDNLPFFDLEYMFIKIRSKSVGEISNIKVTCPDDNKTTVPVKIYIDEIKVVKSPDHNNDIKLDDKLTLRLKYPSLDEFIKSNFDFSSRDDGALEQSFEIIATCIDQVYNEEESWAASDCTKKELLEWVETLNTNQFKLIESFFTTMPKLSHTLKVKNPKTKVENDVTLEGLSSFFA